MNMPNMSIKVRASLTSMGIISLLGRLAERPFKPYIVLKNYYIIETNEDESLNLMEDKERLIKIIKKKMIC